MARSKSNRKFRLKLTVYALLSLSAGITLLILSQKVQPAEESTSASAPATAPAEKPVAPNSKQTAARNLGGLLLLFSMAGFLLTVLCIGWIVVDIRNARPAWKRQKKYPKKR